jgi:hypothetical protein
VVLAIGYTLRAHEALSRPDALAGFLEVVHTLFEDGVSSATIEVYGQAASSDQSINSPSPASTRTSLTA